MSAALMGKTGRREARKVCYQAKKEREKKEKESRRR